MKKYIIICILATLAFINATFLTYKSFFPSEQTFCDLNSKFSCSNVLTNPIANIGGIVPFPMVAMIVYPMLFTLAYTGRKTKSHKNFKLLTILSCGGVLFNSYFIYLEATLIKSFCPLCLICSGIILTIFILSVIGYKKR